MAIGVLVTGIVSVLTRGPVEATGARPAADPNQVDPIAAALGADLPTWTGHEPDPDEAPAPDAVAAARPRRPALSRPMARVAVVFTGGTISTAFDPVAGGNVPTLDGAAILARTPGIDAIAEVVAIDRGRTPASHFTFAELFEIGDVLRESLADPTIDGAVVVQGTDTIEETAFCWDLVLDGAKPVVVTGAMRASDAAGFDGPANLRDAVRVAAAPAMRGAGVVVVLGGTIEPADDVTRRTRPRSTRSAARTAGRSGG